MNAALRVYKTPARQPALSLTHLPTRLLQRKSVFGSIRGTDGESEECQEKHGTTLRRAPIGMSPARDVPLVVHDVLRSSGQPLDSATRAFMEPRFGHDFSQVRVHTDAKAVESARAVNALAYTVGRNVVFGAEQYAPQASAGQQLLAHELTHVVQQSSAAPSNFRIAPVQDAHEQEANSVAQGLAMSDAYVYRPLASSVLQRQPAPPTDDKKKAPAEKEVTTQPPPQKIPASEAKKADNAPAEEKKGVEAAINVGGEAEFKKEQGKIRTEGSAKYTIEVTIPITDKLRVGPLSFVKEAGVEASGGFKFTQDKGTLTNLEAQAAVKVISLDWEKVKVPLGVTDFGISASALTSAEYSPMEKTGAVKFGVGAEAEAKFKRSEKSPFFIKVSGGVEKTYDKEGNADFKWSPLTWKAGGAVGVEF